MVACPCASRVGRAFRAGRAQTEGQCWNVRPKSAACSSSCRRRTNGNGFDHVLSVNLRAGIVDQGRGFVVGEVGGMASGI
jgi:hypothetical protein